MVSRVKRRPPKAWFDRCLRSVGRDPGVDDPSALCGWVWYHHMTPTRALKLLRDGSLRYDPEELPKFIVQFRGKDARERGIEVVKALRRVGRNVVLVGGSVYEYEKGVKPPMPPYDPTKAWDKALKVSGKMLVISRAKAGLRKGKQAFTDLVEVAVNLPSRVYDRLVSEGFFTEYEKGSAARRGKSKRGTNIFISKRK